MRRTIYAVASMFSVLACSSCSSAEGSIDPGGDGATGNDTGARSDTAGGGGDTRTSGDTSTTPGDSSITPGDSSTTPTDTSTTPTDTSTPPPFDSGPAGPGAFVGPCRIYPADNPWNQDISALPVHASATAFAANMHLTTALHADWGTFTEGYGIPYNVGPAGPAQKMTWTESWAAGESDKLPCADGSPFCYPIPSSCKIEGPSDSHLLFLDTAGAPDNCTLYELWQARPFSGSGWTASNGAIFKMGTNALRPDGWTSADAAGLPILPGLVRFDEVKAGKIEHAIRFTMNNTYQGYIHPATHAAGLSSSSQPPMGLRMRLKASVAIGSYSKEAQVILTAMKKYGIILADNGSNWYISGEENDGWGTGGATTIQDGIISAFGKIHGSDFEPVNTGATSTAGL
jgi:hypothetical protein